DRSRERVAQTGFPAVLSRSYLAMALAERGIFVRGIEHAQDAVHLAEALDHPFSLIQALRGLGYVYAIKGHFDGATFVLERGVGLCREWNVRPSLPILMTTLAHVYSLAGRVGEGLPLLEQALATLESLGLTSHYSLCMLRLGDACLLAGRGPEARAVAERALATTREHGERGYEAWALRLSGAVAAREEPLDVEAAPRDYRQAQAIAEELGMRPLVCHCHLGLARLYRLMSRPEQAQEHIGTATAMYREMGMVYWLAQV